MSTSVTDWYEAIQEYFNACANTTSERDQERGRCSGRHAADVWVWRL